MRACFIIPNRQSVATASSSSDLLVRTGIIITTQLLGYRFGISTRVCFAIWVLNRLLGSAKLKYRSHADIISNKKMQRVRCTAKEPKTEDTPAQDKDNSKTNDAESSRSDRSRTRRDTDRDRDRDRSRDRDRRRRHRSRSPERRRRSRSRSRSRDRARRHDNDQSESHRRDNHQPESHRRDNHQSESHRRDPAPARRPAGFFAPHKNLCHPMRRLVCIPNNT